LEEINDSFPTMAKSSLIPEKLTILEGKCHLFQREGSPFWWCGFHFKGKYLRSSTKETSIEAAKVAARNWYFERQSEIAAGNISNPKYTFDKVKDLALAHYKTLVERQIRSQITYDGIDSILKSRVTPYFKNVPVANIDNAMWHKYKEHILDKYPNATRGTLHQYKNAVRVVLNEAYRRGIIKQVPTFKDEYKSKRIEMPRPWFTSAEYSKLHPTILAHAEYLSKVDRRQYEHAMELYDYVIFGTNTGMRVGEMNNVRFCDVDIAVDKLNGKKFLIISNIKGKRGTGTCQSYYGAVKAFESRVEARGIKDAKKSQENIFLIHHRVMFNKILEKTGLKWAKTNPPAKRDFVSLRSTYICFRLLNGVPVFEIANNCRTSVAVIENSYARYLGGALMPNINRTARDYDTEDWEANAEEVPEKFMTTNESG